MNKLVFHSPSYQKGKEYAKKELVIEISDWLDDWMEGHIHETDEEVKLCGECALSKELYDKFLKEIDEKKFTEWNKKLKQQLSESEKE